MSILNMDAGRVLRRENLSVINLTKWTHLGLPSYSQPPVYEMIFEDNDELNVMYDDVHRAEADTVMKF